jgi:hypothetical protein
VTAEIERAGGVINSKDLTQAAAKLAEAVRQARLAYEFSPSSYTCTTLQACLAAARAFDQYVDDLAFAHSAEWLRRFPKISEDGYAE